MRRLLAILLLLASSLPLVPSLLAAGTSPNANLPACCRHHGAHHCMEQMPPSTGRHLIAHTRCPMWPAATTSTASHTGPSLLARSASFNSPPPASPGISAATAFARDFIQQSRHLRGPPSLLA